MSKRSLGLIGAGYWGKNLARNFNALEALHTICDVSEAILEKNRELYPEIRLTTRFEEMLENPEIDKIA